MQVRKEICRKVCLRWSEKSKSIQQTKMSDFIELPISLPRAFGKGHRYSTPLQEGLCAGEGIVSIHAGCEDWELLPQEQGADGQHASA